MFCRWFNHRNLYNKFLTGFCSDSSRVYPAQLRQPWDEHRCRYLSTSNIYMWSYDCENVMQHLSCGSWKICSGDNVPRVRILRRFCCISTLLGESSKFVILTNGRGWHWFLTGCLNSCQSPVWPRTIPLRTWSWLQNCFAFQFYNSFRFSLSSLPPSSPGQWHSCVDWICVQFQIQHHLLALIIMWLGE